MIEMISLKRCDGYHTLFVGLSTFQLVPVDMAHRRTPIHCRLDYHVFVMRLRSDNASDMVRSR